MTSYQKLKKQNQELLLEREKLLTEPSYFIQELMRLKIKKDVLNRIWFGESQPTGKLRGNIKGLLNKLMK